METLDRRRHPRIRVDRACKLLEPRSGRYVPAVARDISTGGVLVEARRSVRCRPGDRLLVAVPEAELAPVVGRDAMVPSRVVRISRRSGALRIAMAFDASVSAAPVA